MPRVVRRIDPEGVLDHAQGDRKFVSALARGLEILRAFSPNQDPLGNNDLAEATGLAKATVTRLTHTLTVLGYLTYRKRAGKYELNPAVLALGYAAINNLRVREIAYEHMRRLADIAEVSVALGSRDRLSMILVEVCNSPALTTLCLNTGMRVEMAYTSIGRAFLAGIPEAERNYFFEHFSRIEGARWPDLKTRILDSIAEVHDRGFCLIDREWMRDTVGIGAPLVSSDGQTVMAMTCGGPSFALPLDRLISDLGPRLANISQHISLQMPQT